MTRENSLAPSNTKMRIPGNNPKPFQSYDRLWPARPFKLATECTNAVLAALPRDIYRTDLSENQDPGRRFFYRMSLEARPWP
jgi:hypothetical protein